MIFDGTLMVSDMDGTLLSEDSRVSKRNIDAIEYFKANGGLFAFASGRNPDNLSMYGDRIKPNAPCICYNGGMIYDFSKSGDDAVVFSECLPERARDFARLTAERFPNASIIPETMNVMNIYNSESLAAKLLLSIVACKSNYISGFSENDVPSPWIKLDFWSDTEEESKELFDYLTSLELPDGMRVLRTYRLSVEILSARTDKGFALEKLRRLLGVKTVCALGDNENDVVMLEKADFSFVPSNAYDCAKRAADSVIPHNCNDDFAAYAVEALEKKLKGGSL